MSRYLFLSLCALGVGCSGDDRGSWGDTGSAGWSTTTTSSYDTDTTTTTTDTDDTDTTDTGQPGTEMCGESFPTLYLSPDDSNSYASAVTARYRVLGGHVPRHTRTYEIFNYYDFDVPAGPTGGVSLTAEWIEDPNEDGRHVLQIGVGAESRGLQNRPPINLTIVQDTSGSMSGSPIRLSRDACAAIASRLKVGDVVSMVTWDTSNNVELSGHAVTGPVDPTLLAKCSGMQSGGGTDLHGGLTKGYQLADENWQAGMTNRLVLVSDGGANVGITDEELISEKAWRGDGRDIFLMGIGVGDDSYNDKLMDTVTDAGRGAAVFIDSEAEAQAVLSDRFLQVFEVAVTDVRLELDLPEMLQIVKASAEDISTNPAQVRPQYLAPNSEMVFYNELTTRNPTCLDDSDEIVARVTYTDPDGARQVERRVFTLGELRQAEHRNALKGRALYYYGEALKTAGAGADAKGFAIAQVTEADAAWPGDPDLAEVRTVLDAL